MRFSTKAIPPIFSTRRVPSFDRGLDLDPDNVDALVGRARVDVVSVASWLSEDRHGRLRSAEADLSKALRLRPDNAHAGTVLGMVRMYSNRALQGIAECERALAIDRNLAAAHAWIGLGKHFAGRDEETEAHVLKRCASARATLALRSGCSSSGSPDFTRTVTKNRSHGYTAQSNSIRIIL